MTELDPESAMWNERAAWKEKPYARIEDKELLLLTVVRDHRLEINETVEQVGHACWRGINRGTMRNKPVRITAWLKQRKGNWEDGRDTSDMAAPSPMEEEVTRQLDFPREPWSREYATITSDHVIIHAVFRRSDPSDKYFEPGNWSISFNTNSHGEETVQSTFGDASKQLESAFRIYPQSGRNGNNPASSSMLHVPVSPRSITPDLYKGCQASFIVCGQFADDASLAAMFVTRGLSVYKGQLPQASTRNERVEKCLAFLLGRELGDEPALAIFLEVLRDRYEEGDDLRDELDGLARDRWTGACHPILHADTG